MKTNSGVLLTGVTAELYTCQPSWRCIHLARPVCEPPPSIVGHAEQPQKNT